MNITYISLDKLKPYAKNARIHSEQQLAELIKSITKFGFNDPIETDSELNIISGHGRFEAAKRIGLIEIPVIIHEHLKDLDQKAYIIAANKIAMHSEWDLNILSEEMQTLRDENFDGTLTGFSDKEIDDLLFKAIAEEKDEDACPDLPPQSKSKLGDVWLLGKHRLMCGDSTSIDAINLLLNSAEIDILFTDPPYNVAFNGRINKFDVIKNDNLSKDKFKDFMLEVFNTIKIINPKIMYIWCNWAFYGLLQDNLEFKACIVWNKTNFGLGKGYRHQHEFCLFNGSIDEVIRNETDVWKVKKDFIYVHPTQKPVELSTRALRNHSKAITVLDLFGGSGSTLIGCHKAGKICFMMELDEKYCDVIIKRWQNFTGKDAVLESTGEVFNGL